ncbi:MAG: universal stress protein [Anaerolineae bacterium]|nr:universal stress protein [Anaerolineae bacterium]
MRRIVCATRGGEAGRRTQEYAISLAKERGVRLDFLCVFDPGFAQDLSKELAAAVYDEQRWLGRALLGIARARAKKEGVHAGVEVRFGPVLETIEAYLRQVDASALVIGAPRVDSALTMFKPNRMRGFAERVAEHTGVEVIVVTPPDE